MAGIGMNGAASEAREVAQQHVTQQGQIIELLQAILAEQLAQVEQLAVTDGVVNGGTEIDSPMPGFRRRVVQRQALGGPMEVTTARVLVRAGNRNRIGGTIVNRGAIAVTLYLCSLQQGTPGIATVTLNGNGGSWDYRLGNVLWAGSISAATAEGATIIDVTEV